MARELTGIVANSTWKPIEVEFTEDSEFTGLGGFQVLEDYDLTGEVGKSSHGVKQNRKRMFPEQTWDADNEIVESKTTSKSMAKKKIKAKNKQSGDSIKPTDVKQSKEEAIEQRREKAIRVTTIPKPTANSVYPVADNKGEARPAGGMSTQTPQAEVRAKPVNVVCASAPKYVRVQRRRERKFIEIKIRQLKDLKKSTKMEPVERIRDKPNNQSAAAPQKPALKDTDPPSDGDNEAELADTTSVNTSGPVPDMPGWKDLFVPDPVLRALSDLKYESPTEIQAKVLPAAIRDHQNILGAAETGSGKTLAFGIPLVNRILLRKKEDPEFQGIHAAVLAPTRELCVQVKNHLQKICKYARIRAITIFGGLAPQKQTRLLQKKPEIIVATPGRLWELYREGSNMHLQTLKDVPLLVIDEADRMVEKGHFAELEKILELMKESENAKQRQNFVFSATLTFTHEAPQRLKAKRRKKVHGLTKDDKINALMDRVGILHKTRVVDLTVKQQTAKSLVESAIFCTQTDKEVYLYYLITRHPGRTLVFTNSIDCIRRVYTIMSLLKIPVFNLHANMQQRQRLKNLERFTANENAVMLATDVAARGLDIPNVEHVIHFQIPRTTESYVHRSGRTARAKKDGISIMIVDEKETQSYRKIMKALDREDGLKEFPIDLPDLWALRKVVSIAQEVEGVMRRFKSKKSRQDWFKHAADEAEIALTSDDSDAEDNKLSEKQNDSGVIHSLKLQLHNALLGLKGDGDEKQYTGRYPTSSGQLELPKQINKTERRNALEAFTSKSKKR